MRYHTGRSYMEHFDYEIHDSLTARVYYTRSGKRVYLIDDEGNELAEVNLLGVDLGSFIRIIKESAKNTGGDL